jgi:hypothetical protein
MMKSRRELFLCSETGTMTTLSRIQLARNSLRSTTSKLRETTSSQTRLCSSKNQWKGIMIISQCPWVQEKTPLSLIQLVLTWLSSMLTKLLKRHLSWRTPPFQSSRELSILSRNMKNRKLWRSTKGKMKAWS